MTIDPASWLKGYADAEIRGDAASFLRQAYRNGLKLTRVRRTEAGLFCRIRLDQLRELHLSARSAHCQVSFSRRSGFPFWLAYLRFHPLILLFAAICVAALLYGSTLVFSVEVVAENAIASQDEARVLQLAEEAGLKPGVSRRKLDLQQVQDYILAEFPSLYFVEINDSGTRVVVRVAKRTDVPDSLALRPPGDLIATSDGVIVDVLVNRGSAAVKQGDTVLKGDVLVYGWMGGQAVAADGIVTARVWQEAEARADFRQTELTPTGKKVRNVSLRFNGGGPLKIWGREDPFASLSQRRSACYPLFMWRKTGFGVEVIVEEIGELSAEETIFSQEDAILQAGRDADLAARGKLFAQHDLGTTDILATQVTEIQTDDEGVTVSVLLEALSEIAAYEENLRTENPLPLPEEE